MNIKDTQKLTDEKWVNLFACDFENKGHVGRWVFASRKPQPHSGRSTDAVIIVPVLRNPGEPARLVLVKEYRVPVGGYIIGFPAGLLEPGEGLEEALRRELREETGLELVEVRRVSPPLFVSAGITDEAVALAFIEVRGEVCPEPDDGEDLEVLLLDYEGVCRLCADPDGWFDVKVWELLYHYQQLGRIE
jgi:ADP-ribose pyrophosphatase